MCDNAVKCGDATQPGGVVQRPSGLCMRLKVAAVSFIILIFLFSNLLVSGRGGEVTSKIKIRIMREEITAAGLSLPFPTCASMKRKSMHSYHTARAVCRNSGESCHPDRHRGYPRRPASDDEGRLAALFHAWLHQAHPSARPHRALHAATRRRGIGGRECAF